jgi:hypothetical protein
MSAKYRKLHPDQLLCLAGEVTAGARAVVAMAQRDRIELQKTRTRNVPASEYHHLVHGARELNSAMRSLSELAITFREELFQAARSVKQAHRQKRKAAPTCGALRASGGRCGTRLEPGEFRCPLHANELRRRREGKASQARRTTLTSEVGHTVDVSPDRGGLHARTNDFGEE